jgi:predicted nucleotidyltransferase
MAEDSRLNRLEAALRAASAALSGHPWALVGGLAVSARTEPRFTRDVDLAVAVSDDAEAEALVHSLLGSGYRVLAMVEQQAQRRLATVRLQLPGETAGGVVVDLLFASSGIEAEVVASAEPLEILPSLTVPVARTGHLITLKLLSRDERRPQDAADLQSLVATADATETARAREAARLIVARGFDRGRDLVVDCDALFAPRRSS